MPDQPFKTFLISHGLNSLRQKSCLNSTWVFMILPKKNFLKHQNIAILDLKLLNSRIWRTLKSTVVVLQALETSPASLTSMASATSLASTASKAQFPQKTSWSWWSDHHWHQNNQYWQFFCGMDHQKSNFSLIYGTLSDRGRWSYVRSKKF